MLLLQTGTHLDLDSPSSHVLIAWPRCPQHVNMHCACDNALDSCLFTHMMPSSVCPLRAILSGALRFSFCAISHSPALASAILALQFFFADIIVWVPSVISDGTFPATCVWVPHYPYPQPHPEREFLASDFSCRPINRFALQTLSGCSAFASTTVGDFCSVWYGSGS